MTEYIHVVGIDPGLVHTGCVRLRFWPGEKRAEIEHAVFSGTSPAPVRDWTLAPGLRIQPRIFIEGYRPRSHLGTDEKMVTAVNQLKLATGGKVLLNEGVKKVIRPELMKLLEVWFFTTPTHHQDLRSAARIALFGMVKDEHLNQVLADVVRDHLDGRSWQVKTC